MKPYDIRTAHFISIHAPRAGGDPDAHILLRIVQDFNPRPPCGGRRLIGVMTIHLMEFQSTPPVRGATSGMWDYDVFILGISIHAPRAGGDLPEGT